MLFPISFNIAAAVGPVLGGQLADLGSRFPDTFGNSQFLKKWPYAPPAIANGVLMLISLILVFFFLEEVSPRSCESPTDARKHVEPEGAQNLRQNG